MRCMSTDVHQGKRIEMGGQELQVVLLADTDVAFCPYSAFLSTSTSWKLMKNKQQTPQYDHKLWGGILFFSFQL